MKFIKVEGLPKIRKHKITCAEMQAQFDEFMNLNTKICKVEFKENEYSTTMSARNTLHTSAKRYGYPIKVVTRNDVIYFVRLDI